MVSEDAAAPTASNIELFDLGSSSSAGQIPGVTAAISYPAGTAPATVHHLRGVGRTGFTSQYADGVSLVDLSIDANDHLEVLGSFDTTPNSAPPPPRNPLPLLSQQILFGLLDSYVGAWDVSPIADSGLIYTTSSDRFGAPGGTGDRGAIVLRLDQGHVGRYWDATPYGAGQTSAGYFPRIVPAFGPPRANRGFTIVDGNRSQLAQTNAGGAKMHYIWTLCYSSDVPQPNGTLYGVTNWHTLGITFNLFESTPPTYTTIENPMDSDSFYMPDVGTVGKVRYLQMLVQQVIEDPITGHLTETGIYAASRGTWYGVAP